MKSRLLEITFLVYGFNRRIYGSDPEWTDCMFEQDEDLTIRLRFQEFGIASATDRATAEARIDQQLQRLVLAWEYRFGRRLHVRRHITQAPVLASPPGIASARSGVAFSARAIVHDYPGPPPDAMPQAPLFAARWIKAMAEAGEFNGFPDEELRRYYLVIEELWEEFKPEFSDEMQTKKDEINMIRDFVSHDRCNKPAIVELVSEHLSDAEFQVGEARFVRFLRTPEHRNFIARYERPAHDLARHLIDMKWYVPGLVDT